MIPPQPYSAFHICITAAGFLIAVLAAYVLSRKMERKTFIRLLIFCGVILAGSEIYKQLFLYFVVNQEKYDWWYFPFQPAHVFLSAPAACEKQEAAADYTDLYAGF